MFEVEILPPQDIRHVALLSLCGLRKGRQILREGGDRKPGARAHLLCQQTVPYVLFAAVSDLRSARFMSTLPNENEGEALMFGIPARPLEQLLGRRTGALTNFFANGDSLRQGINGLVQHALLIGGGRHGYPLLIVLLETGHALDGSCRRVELLVRDIRRLLGETGRGRLDLSVRCREEEKSRRNQQARSG